ncbi:acetyltransferase [Wenjunlia vitaminophila]|uniref:Acetyltransferase n=1 Tax=Wenjunlia vitaminophila TaxID=76728 RepID=A0A0T6LVX9_WENVI|nr:GNAT family N-acetyltransferase [Wenjunlia vitaminophila]KRV50311.1 acetyltransferase [Wenjunlia vitaminophila]
MGMSVTISPALEHEAESILKLQYLCYQSEAELYGDYSIEPLTQTLDELRAELATGYVLVARLGDEVIGSVRARVEEDGSAAIGKLIVHPRMRRHGLGGRLLKAIEARLAAERQATRYRLFTGHRSAQNLRLYRSLGYRPVGTAPAGRGLDLVTMEKEAAPSATDSGGALAASA